MRRGGSHAEPTTKYQDLFSLRELQLFLYYTPYVLETKVDSLRWKIFPSANVSLSRCRYFERVSANRLEKIFADSAPFFFPLINVLGICIWLFQCSSDPFVSLSALVVEVFSLSLRKVARVVKIPWLYIYYITFRLRKAFKTV